MRISFVLLILLFTSINCYSQKSGKYVAPIIKGIWTIDFRGPIVNPTNLDLQVEQNPEQEILNADSEEITFELNKYRTSNKKSGNYTFKGSTLTLNDTEYKCSYYSDDKFSLVRRISAGLLYGYMLERKK